MTGHAHHFLSRLDRVERAHVELALSLYNDAPLLGYVLARARLPDGAERVAISMSDVESGPFLVVTRGGAFVTCLGAGMSPGDLPVITRGQLDGVSHHVAELRERIEIARRIAPGKGALDRLLARIRQAGPWLGRDEFRALCGIAPMLGEMRLVGWLAKTTGDVEDLRARLLRRKLLDRAGRVHGAEEEALELYYREVFALGHLGLLAFLEGPRAMDAMPAELVEKLAPILSWPMTRQGVLSLAVRGAWVAAKVGKACLHAYRRRMREAVSDLGQLDCSAALTAIALRHERLAAEARKSLVVPTFPDQPGMDLRRQLAELRMKTCGAILDEAEEVRQAFEDAARDYAVALTAMLPQSSPYRYTSPEDVPRDVALALPCNSLEECIDPEQALHLYAALPFVATARAEDLYLPDDFVQATRIPWHPDHTLALLKRYQDHYGKPRPVRVEKTPGRNDPCSCGSGKKWKRCCGAVT